MTYILLLILDDFVPFHVLYVCVLIIDLEFSHLESSILKIAVQENVWHYDNMNIMRN